MWGLVDQGISSVTNFLGSVFAARALSTSRFGSVAIGYSLYFIAVAVYRSLVSDVLVVRFAAESPEDQRSAICAGAAGTLGVAAAMAVVGLAISALLPTEPARVVQVLMISLPLILLQDFCRLGLIMMQRSAAAAFNDGVWLLLTVIAFGLFRHVTTPVGSFSLWIIGGLIAGLVGLAQLGTLPSAHVLVWWRTHKYLSSRYLADALLILSSNYAFTVGIGVVAGGSEVAGLRGAQVLMGPLTVLFLGLTIQAMPSLVRRAATSRADARRGAVQLGILFSSTAALFGVVLITLPKRFGRALLGDTSTEAFTLMPGVACMFAVLGFSIALGAGLKALGAAQSTLRIRMVTAPLAVAGGVVGFMIGRTEGAVFGLAIGSAAGLPMWWRSLRDVSAASVVGWSEPVRAASGVEGVRS